MLTKLSYSLTIYLDVKTGTSLRLVDVSEIKLAVFVAKPLGQHIFSLFDHYSCLNITGEELYGICSSICKCRFVVFIHEKAE